MVLHVILRRMREDNRRLDFANDRREFAQRSKVIKDFEIVAQAGVIERIQNPRGAPRFEFAIFSQLLRAHCQAAA